MLMLKSGDVFPAPNQVLISIPLPISQSPVGVTEVFCECNFVCQWKVAIQLENSKQTQFLKALTRLSSSYNGS